MAISKAQIRATAKYSKKAYERLYIRVKMGEKDAIINSAEKAGESLNEFITKAIQERIERM